MSGIAIAIKDTVTPAIRRKLSKLGGLLPIWNRVGIKVHRSVLMNFKQGGRPIKWKPSIRATKEAGQTLIDTGLLRASIGFKVEQSISDSTIEVGIQDVGETLKNTSFSKVKDGAKVGTQVLYGPFHDQGVGMVKREFLLLQDEDQRAIEDLLDKHLS